MTNAHYPLAGSERAPMRGARAIGAASPHERLEVTIAVRRPPSSDLQDHLAHAAPGHFLSGEEFARAHGADMADFDAVAEFARDNHLAVAESNAARRSLTLSGVVADFHKASNLELHYYEHAEGAYRGRTGPNNLPEDLKDIVEGVFGLDNRPQAKPHFRRADGQIHAYAASSHLTPPQLAELYAFPSCANGADQTIALIELGGGFKPRDLAAYFKQLGICPAPKVTAVSVSHGHNTPAGDPDGPNGEVMLDIEVAGAIAPGAHVKERSRASSIRSFMQTQPR